MNEQKKERKGLWAILAAALSAVAFFLRFCLRGYAWWGYALLFVAALVVLHRLASSSKTPAPTLSRSAIISSCSARRSTAISPR